VQACRPATARLRPPPPFGGVGEVRTAVTAVLGGELLDEGESCVALAAETVRRAHRESGPRDITDRLARRECDVAAVCRRC
jgi:hypothetical protein